MVQKKKSVKKKKSASKNKASTDKQILDEIIRVDHAGEYGATRIYDGQIAIFGKNSKIGKTIQHMADQEQEHIEKFNELIIEKRVRPTALLPLWNVAGFALGAGTALMGEKAAMACTVAVEKVIGEHYRDQQELLKDDEEELRKTIAKFEKDELEHHDIGIDHDAENAPGYKLMTKITYIEHNGKEHTIDVQNGLTVMEGAIQNDIPGIDADCGGSMACATCHVYVKDDWYDKLDEKSEGEDDMIDQAYEPRKNSRLSCQITVSDKTEGLVVHLPEKQV